MIEFRFLVEDIRATPKLQFRVKEGPKGEEWWGEWQTVPVVMTDKATDQKYDL